MTYYEILEGIDKGNVIRVCKGLGEIKTDSGWEPYNAMDVLFNKVNSRCLTDEEIVELEK